jgi:hypothetical protein
MDNLKTPPKVGVLDVAKNVGVGIFNRTLGRLRGSGIQKDSLLVKARAKWSGRDSQKDWRVRLTLPARSNLRNVLLGGDVTQPLRDSNGMFWPLTPSMIIQHSANYNALAQTHSNYPFQAYQNSQVDQMNIIGEFPVQNSEDAKHWVATVHFLRTVTKMFFGGDDYKGNPPPILHLSGYGDHMFHNVPVVVNTFNVELRAGIDYISTKQSQVYHKQLTDFDDEEGADATWAPTISNISVLVTPTYSRETLKSFSLQKFASGNLSNFGATKDNKNSGIGFI